MLKSWRINTRAPASFFCLLQRRQIADARTFREGDIVLLRQKLDRSAPPILTRPLKVGKQVSGHKGLIQHDDIIGKRVRDIVQTLPSKRTGNAGVEFRVHDVKLEEYVKLTRRLVTPIYPSDARLIVELLDLHPEPFDPGRNDQYGQQLEILEAGTGHGALTLYLSRAIHGANARLPSGDQEGEIGEEQYQAWRRRRGGIIHSIEHNKRYSNHAQSVVRGFRNGVYFHNVDFNVTDVSAWTRKALAERQEQAFLSHAFLDLPGADKNFEIVAKALRTDGCLVAFQPSITQILECQKNIRQEVIALELENVIELGVNSGSGGREWNVRMVRPRAARVAVAEEAATMEGSPDADDSGEDAADAQYPPFGAQVDDSSSHSDSRYATTAESSPTIDAVDDSSGSERTTASPTNSSDWAMICRPRVGDRVVGGGFLGVWRKQRR